MSRIRQLNADVINKIAAGEVIERPASVVKELLENSIDALATRVDVDIVQGGAELIRVVDDGEGIHPDDLLLSVCSHATSKIETADDLFRVLTMGFRGEALASIASISRFRIRSRQSDSAEGVELEVNGGQAGRLQPSGCPAGTLIEVSQLFANTPVRRKFLKTTGTEFGHISEQFTRIALANPRLHMTLKHNGKIVHELPASDRLIDRLRMFYGNELADNLIQVESETGGVRLWGYVAHPSQHKSTRKGQYLYLNGRWIQDRALQHALSEAYRGILMVGRQPIAFLFYEMPADLVDVNVHPSKWEVRFRDGQQLYRQLLATLRTKFLGMDFETSMQIRGNRGDQPSPAQPSADPQQQRETQAEFADWAKAQLDQWSPPTETSNADSGNLTAGTGPQFGLPTAPEQYSRADERLPTMEPAVARPVPDQQTIADSDQGGSGRASASAGNSRVIQVLDTYLVVETAAGLTVIDQHALHERVIYEQLRRRVLSHAIETQRLLVPETIELSAKEAALLIEHRDLVHQLGFEIEEFGGSTILLTGYPVMLSRADHPQLIRDIVERLESPEQNPTRRDILDSLLHMMSCKAAIKAGQELTTEEMHSLMQQRHLIDDAHHCPHGRPTALVLSRAELDRQFGRLG